MQVWMTDCSFTQCTLNTRQSGCSAIWLWHGWNTWNCCRLSTSSEYTIQLCTTTSLWCHFIWSHNCRMHVCLAVTCQLHFWQNDWDLLCATAVTWGWNGYQNKSPHKKLTLKNILPPLLPGHKSKNFQSWVHHSTTEPFLIPIIVTHEYKLLYHQLYHDVHQWYWQLYHDVHQWYWLVISVMCILHLLLLTITLCYTAPYQATPHSTTPYHTIHTVHVLCHWLWGAVVLWAWARHIVLLCVPCLLPFTTCRCGCLGFICFIPCCWLWFWKTCEIILILHSFTQTLQVFFVPACWCLFNNYSVRWFYIYLPNHYFSLTLLLW